MSHFYLALLEKYLRRHKIPLCRRFRIIFPKTAIQWLVVAVRATRLPAPGPRGPNGLICHRMVASSTVKSRPRQAQSQILIIHIQSIRPPPLLLKPPISSTHTVLSTSHYRTKLTSDTNNLRPLAIALIVLASYGSMSFLSRFFRPFTTTMTSAAPATPMTLPEGAERATIAAGCFWGVEHMYRKAFAGKGLVDARVGYIGGDTESPSYRAVCSGRTGHAEALQIIYKPEEVSYRTLLEFFYKMHDPTTRDSQGPDVGSQYRSGIFYHGEEQEKVAREVTEKVNKEWWKGKVVTEILPAGTWWDAETYHQLYLDKSKWDPLNMRVNCEAGC